MVETKPLLLTHHLANVLLQYASHQKLPEKLITDLYMKKTFCNIVVFTAVVTKKSADII